MIVIHLSGCEPLTPPCAPAILLQVKQFDVDTHFMGRNRAGQLRQFSRIPDMAERLALLREALGGGSMTPEAMRGLKRHVAAGLITLHEREEITGGWRACGLVVVGGDAVLVICRAVFVGHLQRYVCQVR